MHLSEHFTLGEVTKTSVKTAGNIPSHVAIENLKNLCENWLEDLRYSYNTLYPSCHLERSREISPCASLSRDDTFPDISNIVEMTHHLGILTIVRSWSPPIRYISHNSHTEERWVMKSMVFWGYVVKRRWYNSYSVGSSSELLISSSRRMSPPCNSPRAMAMRWA